MKLFIFLLVLLVLLGFVSGITIIPYQNSCNEAEPSGIGYDLPLDTYFTLDEQYNGYVKLNGTILTVYWLEQCTYPINLSNATNVFSYTLNSCAYFKAPFTSSFLSSISSSSSLPTNAIVTSYYYNSEQCNGDSWKQFYTNGYTQEGIKFLCRNGQPFQYYCDTKGCHYVPLYGCSGVWNNIYPTETTC